MKALSPQRRSALLAHPKRSAQAGFLNANVSSAAGFILLICTAISSMAVITAASASIQLPDDGSFVRFTRPVKPTIFESKVLGEAVNNADNQPVCIDGDCFHYMISNPNIQDYSPADVTAGPIVDQPAADLVPETNKKIIVSLHDQNLVYMEGSKIIGEFKISSGLARTPSPKGEFKVEVKKPVVNYVGADYSYRGTKWNLLFKPNPSGNYYIHGAFWHNNFGRPMSHGCINVSYENMEKIYNWADVGTKVIVQDEPVIPLADGALVLDTSDGKTLYLINSGKKLGFTSREVFEGLGYNFSEVRKSNLSGYPTGQPIGSAAGAHPPGTLIKYQTEVYKVADGGKRLIPNENIFSSWGWAMSQVVEANAADLRLPNLDNIKYREGTLLRAGDGMIYVAADGRFKRFFSAAIYGDKADTLVYISDAELSQ